MAEMFPPECSKATRSTAERKIFERIRLETSRDWFGLHSVGLTNHNRKPWAEIDFVLIGPYGIFCIEVKGGRVRRSDGMWHFTDGDGNTSSKAEGPFDQAASAAAALRKHLAASNPELRHIPVGWGVVTPDITFNVIGSDIELRVVLDDRENGRPFNAYLRRLADYWHGRIEEITGHPAVSLSEKQRRAALNVIRGDFDLRPSLRARVDVVHEDLLTLTQEQYRVLDSLSDNARSVIRGFAGSGKTLLAIEEARRQSRAGARVFFCCRTARLAAFLKQATADVVGVDCHDLRTFMSNTAAAAQLSHLLPPAQEEDLFSIFLPELCIDALLQLDRFQSYDVLIVDEAQDLLAKPFIDLFDALLLGGVTKGRWMLFLDTYQDLFQAVSPDGWRKLLETNPAQFRLSINCRNTKPVAIAAQILSGVTWEETLHVAGPDVEQHFFDDDSQQQRDVSNCIKRWLGDGIKPGQIVVLAARPFKESFIRRGLIEVPYPVVDAQDRRTTNKEIGFYQISQFKGLEADMVVVIDVDDLDSPAALFSIYVGASRARAGLAVFISTRVSTAYARQATAYGERLRVDQTRRLQR